MFHGDLYLEKQEASYIKPGAAMSDDLDLRDLSQIEDIGAVCRRFEAAWIAGQRPRIEEFLAHGRSADSPVEHQLFLELVAIDLEHRWQADLAEDQSACGAADELPVRPRLTDYVARFPCLGPLEDLPSPLVVREYLVRRAASDGPDRSEYLSTFHGGARLAAALAEAEGTEALVGTDDEKGRTRRVGEPPVPVEPPGAPPPADAREAPPAAIGRYRVIEELGAGGFGSVYRCRDEQLDRDVAVKLFPRQALSGDEQVDLFLHEAKAAARLAHPGVVAVLDAGRTEDGRGFVVYELVRGRPLEARIAARDYSRDDAIRWVIETAEALHAAHKRNIVHRDIKPANILIDETGRARLTDFGIAKLDDRFVADDTGVIIGTLAYMSPEQAMGQSHWASPQSDIYSLGAVLYELLCRRMAFAGGSFEQLRQQVIGRPVLPPRTLDDSIPRRLEAVCLKALEKRQEDRFHTAADMAAALRRAVGTRQSRYVYVGLAGVVVMAAAVSVVVELSGNRLRPTDAAKPAAEAEKTTDAPAAEVPVLRMHLLRDGEIHVVSRSVGHDLLPLRDKDRIQLHASVAAGQYVYIFWYDAEGRPKRLWPSDPLRATAPGTLVLPAKPDDASAPLWYPIQGERGVECVLLAAAEEPLSKEDVAELENTRLVLPPRLDRDKTFQVVVSPLAMTPGVSVERGLGDPEPAPLALSETDLVKKLNARSMRYYGFLVRHQ